ncbi:hypothetical protein H5410_053484 [Solanum commersonii]|uniref:Uncharacterized protein n=1 Tax=Solanum commersonii TaxID=4109 RepID=A0A9J5X3L9_SOLCO|nr:hypothetical protein H5410_053484 [Solanum commersonii]
MSNHRQTHRSSRNRTHIDSSPNYRNHQQRQQQRSYNPRTSRGPNFGALYNRDNEDDNHDHEVKEVKEDYLLKYLKIRTYYGEDEIDFEVESDICAICQCEYEDEESIGELALRTQISYGLHQTVAAEQESLPHMQSKSFAFHRNS